MNQTARQWSKVMETHSGYRLAFGPTNVDRYVGDPKRLGFFMARYKFAGKMLSRCQAIIDVGCGDGMGTLGFLSETEASRIVGVDFERSSIGYAMNDLTGAVDVLRPGDKGRLRFAAMDFLECGRDEIQDVAGRFDFNGLASLDVIEHIAQARAPEFIARMADMLCDYGIAVIGTPSLAGQQYASVHSRAGHINLYDPDRLRSELEKQFSLVFMFSMNDEVVHTGFDKLAHYLIAVAVK